MLALIIAALAVATPAELSPVAEEAVKIVAPRASDLPGFNVGDEGQPADPDGYYLFEASWSGNANGGSVHLAGLLISKYDGDVWDGSTCEHLSSNGLRKAQRLLRKKMKLTSSDLARLVPPRCAAER